MPFSSTVKSIARALLPPIVTDGLRALRRRQYVEVTSDVGGPPVRKLEWEMMPNTDAVWAGPEGGWSHASIADRQAEKWDSFLADLCQPNALGRSHEAAADAPTDVSAHNTIVTFGYVLGRIVAEHAAERGPVRVLDWGGGVGHYYRYAKTLLPKAELDYVVKELDVLCDMGRKLNASEPVRFVSDLDEIPDARFHFVFASSSLQYTRDIYALVDRLLGATSDTFMVTRMPFVEHEDDFVVVQRPHRYGYLTEYAGWFLNAPKFIEFVCSRGFQLEREFLLAERPFVANAPEQCRYRGFSFKRKPA